MAELGGFEVLALAKEIGRALQGTYVNNVFSIGDSQLIRFRKPQAEDVWLVVNPRRGAWVSGRVSGKAETREFTSKLRSELERMKFRGARQVDLDRVFEFVFEGPQERRLVVELMPPGNLVVTDATGAIRLVQTEVRAPSRRVVRGGVYQPPRQSRLSPSEVGVDEVRDMIRAERTAGKAIGRHVGIPRKYVAETLARLGVGEDTPSNELAGKEVDVSKVIRGMVEEARDSPRPCLCPTDRGMEIYVIPPTGVVPTLFAPTVSELCDKLFLEETMAGEEAPSVEEAKRKELMATISTLRSESDAHKEAAAKARAAAAEVEGKSLEDSLGMLTDVGVRPGKEPGSAEAVASILYDHAKALEARALEATEAADRLGKRLEKVGPPTAQKTRPITRRRQEWFQKFRWFVTSGGKLAVGGRDAMSNTLLLTRHLEDDDLVYHADLFGSPFFVLKGGRGQSEAEVLELAQATVSFSSGWKTGLGAADAYWVLKDQVSRTTESGEYLTKGSFVIRGKKNFVRHAMLQLAVGLDGQGRVVAGPEAAVAAGTDRYLVITPHREKPSDTAKKVLKELLADGGEGPTLDDVVRALPAGGGKIVRRKGGASVSG